jgi:hypothetical protein
MHCLSLGNYTLATKPAKPSFKVVGNLSIERSFKITPSLHRNHRHPEQWCWLRWFARHINAKSAECQGGQESRRNTRFGFGVFIVREVRVRLVMVMLPGWDEMHSLTYIGKTNLTKSAQCNFTLTLENTNFCPALLQQPSTFSYLIQHL